MIVGLIGCGNIGTEIMEYLDSSLFFNLKYISDTDPSKSEKRTTSFSELVQKSDLIIEAASADVVKRILKQNLIGKKVMILSVGGLLEEDIPKNCEILIPSGAISGIDSLKAVGGLITNLKLITTKPPAGLEGSPYVIENDIDLYSISKKETIFQGSLHEALRAFPKNINVAATIFLATGVAPEVSVICDPNAKNNIHHIVAEGSFGKLDLMTENVPSKNPKTSYLAVLSAIRCLKNIESNIKLG